MMIFSDAELAYLTGEPHLGRLATVGPDGMPHVTPVGWSYNSELQTIDIDEVLPPWRPRGIEVRGDAAAIDQPTPLIRIQPTRVVSWGLEGAEADEPQARTGARNPQ